jgi:hypothetical protein
MSSAKEAMDAFGVRFEVTNGHRFEALSALYRELAKDKNAETFRNPDAWLTLVPDYAKTHFDWPAVEERKEWAERRPFTPILIGNPSDQLGAQWDFCRVLESIEDGEYTLLSCEMVDAIHAEMRIDPWAYPYGGLGALIALVESFGFRVVGVNECGRYETRELLLGRRGG